MTPTITKVEPIKLTINEPSQMAALSVGRTIKWKMNGKFVSGRVKEIVSATEIAVIVETGNRRQRRMLRAERR